ncbi:MAG: thioesterase family protein [Planctomycetota bacterium]
MEYVTCIPIRFADVDAAGIVYYPQFFDYYHCAFEEMFGDTTGTAYADWLTQRRRGFPTVHVEADFTTPLEYGQTLQIAITVPRIGGSSLDYQFVARTERGTAAQALITKVCIDMDRREPAPIPEDLIAVLRGYGADQ